jgi:hypothetical protein
MYIGAMRKEFLSIVALLEKEKREKRKEKRENGNGK